MASEAKTAASGADGVLVAGGGGVAFDVEIAPATKTKPPLILSTKLELTADNLKQLAGDLDYEHGADNIDKESSWEVVSVRAMKSIQAYIKRASINEIKSYSSPPQLMKTVMEAVSIIFVGAKQDWKAHKKMIGTFSFAKQLQEFDVDSKVSNKMLQALEPYAKNPDFTPGKVKSISKVAMSLCEWVLAVYEYGQLNLLS